MTILLQSATTQFRSLFLTYFVLPSATKYYKVSGITKCDSYYKVRRNTGHFQYANTDHIMTLSLIRIEFTDDSFNIILHEFNVCQVLIGNRIS